MHKGLILIQTSYSDPSRSHWPLTLLKCMFQSGIYKNSSENSARLTVTSLKLWRIYRRVVIAVLENRTE